MRLFVFDFIIFDFILLIKLDEFAADLFYIGTVGQFFLLTEFFKFIVYLIKIFSHKLWVLIFFGGGFEIEIGIFYSLGEI